MRPANDARTRRARQLRLYSTRAEQILWNRIRSRTIAGCKFVRQQPVGPYIVDFVCRSHKLVIEVDGGQHAENRRDAVRDDALRKRGYRLLRFWNNDVIGNTAGVLETIAAALQAETPPHPDR